MSNSSTQATTRSYHPSGWNPEASTEPPISHVPSLNLDLQVRQPWPVGHVFLDEFEVQGVLGQGGMGMVYLVRQLSTTQHFAVKRARLAHSDSRRRFLAELQLWMDLPPHPHLAPCRFFRTVDDEVVIFTDLATGGSLADWISQGRLRRLPQLLDIAIQVAWGLHALHERGLIHQDVKPANVLMRADGLAQVADFGLTRARVRYQHPPLSGDASSVVVSSGALTPAYCSPEQFAAQPVSRRTDVWSWGVLVLEMFLGRVPCCDRGGPHAPEVLQRYLQTSQHANRIEVMPAGVLAVLQLCFAYHPAQRWPNLLEPAEELARIYRQLGGVAHPRHEPVRPAPAVDGLVSLARTHAEGRWESPRKWLALAFQAAGRDPTDIETILPPLAASPRAQAVADLTAYEDARQILELLVSSGRDDLRPSLAGLVVQKALVHASVGDWPSALELFDRALICWEELIHAWGRRELTPWLVRTCLFKAQALRTLGQHHEALSLCDRVLSLWNRLDNRKRRREMRPDLAATLLEKGLILRDRGNRRAALPHLHQAIELGRKLVEHEDQLEPANDLARALLALAGIQTAFGKFREALELCDQAITLHRRLVQKEDRRDLEGELARAFVIKANVFRAQDNLRACLPLYEQALSLYQQLLHEGRDDLGGELARAWIAYAHALRVLGSPERAAELCARAVALLEQLVHQQGRSDLQHELARAYLQHGNSLRQARQAGVALLRCDQAIAVWERLVHREGRADRGNDLARAYVGKAGTLLQLGQRTQALDLYDRAIVLRQTLLTSEMREDIELELARDRVSRAEILSELGDRERAFQEAVEAATILDAVLRQTGRADLQRVIRRARRVQQKCNPTLGLHSSDRTRDA